MPFFIILAIVLFAVNIFWIVQLTEVGIHVLNPSGGGFMDTSNFFAWIVVFLLMSLISLAIRFVFSLLNIFLAYGFGSILQLFARRKTIYGYADRVEISAVLIWISWAVATFFFTAATMAFFSQNPQLNSWLAEGNWLAHVLAYLAIFGLVCPGKSRD